MLTKPLTKGPPSPVMLPRQAALALRRMMDHTDVEKLVLRSDAKRAWLVATCRDGAEWTVSFKLVDAVYPSYKEVGERMASAASMFSATVDMAELRGVMAPLGCCNVAVFADGGLVAWPCRGDDEIAMSLAAYPSGYPLTVISSDGLGRVLKGVKAAQIPIDVCGPWKKLGAEIRIDGRVTTPIRIHRDKPPTFPDDWSDGLPGWVRERLAVEFGLAPSAPAPDRTAEHQKLLAEALADEHKRDHVPDLFGSADKRRTAITNLGTKTAAAALRNAVVVNRRDGTFLAMPGDKVKPYPYPVLHLGLPTKRDQKAVKDTGMLLAERTSKRGGSKRLEGERPAERSVEGDPAVRAPAPMAAGPRSQPAPASVVQRRAAARVPRPAASEQTAAAPQVTPDAAASIPAPAAALPVAVPAPAAPLSAAKRAWLTRRANGWTPKRRPGAAAPAAASSPVAAVTTLSPAQRAWVTRRANGWTPKPRAGAASSPAMPA
jgi:hypothetical protein